MNLISIQHSDYNKKIPLIQSQYDILARICKYFISFSVTCQMNNYKICYRIKYIKKFICSQYIFQLKGVLSYFIVTKNLLVKASRIVIID